MKDVALKRMSGSLSNPVLNSKFNRQNKLKQISTPIVKIWEWISLFVIEQNTSLCCFHFSIQYNMMWKTHLNQGPCFVIYVEKFLWPSWWGHSWVYRDDKQREVKLRQDLRSAEWHARLRRLQPATHQPKTGSSIGQPNTLVNRVKDAPSRTSVTLAHRSNSCDYHTKLDAFLVKHGNECSAEDRWPPTGWTCPPERANFLTKLQVYCQFSWTVTQYFSKIRGPRENRDT